MLIRLTSTFVGEDEFGNRYYESKKVNRTFGRRARYVVYKGIVEASKVPGHWSSWLHFQSKKVPVSNAKLYRWEIAHTPNFTGTRHAYFPSGYVKAAAKRDKATGDYVAWEPKE